MWDEGSKPTIRTDIQYRELDDGAVVYDTAAERIHVLNVTAAYIWNCCDGARDISQISSELRRHTDVSTEEAMEDVREAVAYFDAEGLLRIA